MRSRLRRAANSGMVSQQLRLRRRIPSLRCKGQSKECGPIKYFKMPIINCALITTALVLLRHVNIMFEYLCQSLQLRYSSPRTISTKVCAVPEYTCRTKRWTRLITCGKPHVVTSVEQQYTSTLSDLFPDHSCLADQSAELIWLLHPAPPQITAVSWNNR